MHGFAKPLKKNFCSPYFPLTHARFKTSKLRGQVVSFVYILYLFFISMQTQRFLLFQTPSQMITFKKVISEVRETPYLNCGADSSRSATWTTFSNKSYNSVNWMR